MKTSHFLLTILLFLALSVCLPPAALSAEGGSDVRPGETNPVTTARHTLFRDDEVTLFRASPNNHHMRYMYAIPNDDKLSAWTQYYDDRPSFDFVPLDGDIRPIASASGRNPSHETDYTTYAFFQADGSVAVEQYHFDLGWNPVTHSFSGSTFPVRSLDIALGDLDGLSDDEGWYHDEIVLVRTTDDGDVKVDVISHDDDLTSLANDTITYNDGRAEYVAVDIGDLNGDGTFELVIGIQQLWGHYQLVVYEYSGDGVIELFKASTYIDTHTSYGNAFDLAVGDFDGDGKDEVFLAAAVGADIIDLLGADDDLKLQRDIRKGANRNGVPNTVRVVSGLFKFDPDTGWPLSRRHAAVCYQDSRYRINCNIWEVKVDQDKKPTSIDAVYGVEISPADVGWSFPYEPGFTSMDLTTGNFVGHGVAETETSPVMDLAVSYVECKGDQAEDKVTNLRPVMKILSPPSSEGELENNWTWTGEEQDYVQFNGNWQMATTVSAADGDGDTYRLGAPAHIVMDKVLRLDRIIQEPPKHVDYLPKDYDDHKSDWDVINVSGYSDFAVTLKDESEKTLETETTSTSSWTIGGDVELDVKATVTLGDMDIAGTEVTAASDTKLGYDYEENKSSYNSDYHSQTITQETTTATDDILQGLVHTIDVWRYPILGYYNKDTDSENKYGYQEIVMPGPAISMDMAAGRDHPDWYQPVHENHNLLSYPFHDMSTSWEPDDLGSFNVGDEEMSVVMNNDILMHWNGNKFTYEVVWSEEAGEGKEKDYNNTLSESEEITIGYQAKADVLFGTIDTEVTGKISFHNSNSWGGETVSKGTNSNSTGIEIGYEFEDNPSDAGYEYKSAAYITSTGGTFKVAYAVGAPQADWWHGQYGRKPDPALNLPLRLKWHQADVEHDDTEYWYLNTTLARHKMRGFLMRESTEDPDTKEYPLLSSMIVDGDIVRLCARVYNYSLGVDTGFFDVKFYYYPWDIEEARQVHDPVFQSLMVANKVSLDKLDTLDGTSRKEVCVDWDTTGLSTEYTYNGEIVNTFRFQVILDEDDYVDEIHELYDDKGNEVLGTNNIGTYPWVNAVTVSPKPDPGQPAVDLDQNDLRIAAGSMAVKTEQGIVSTNEKGGRLHLELGKTYEIRALVEADQDHPFHRLVFLYDGHPDGKDKGKRKGHPAGKGKVIGSSRVHGLEAGSTYVWMRWTPDTLGKQEVWMRLYEDADEMNPGNAIDSLAVIVVPEKKSKSHPKKIKRYPKKNNGIYIECRCFNDNDIKWISHKQYVCNTSDPRYDTSDFVFVEHGDTDDKDYVDFHVEKNESGQYWCGTYEEDHMDRKYMNNMQFKDCWDIMTKYLDCPPYQPCPE